MARTTELLLPQLQNIHRKKLKPISQCHKLFLQSFSMIIYPHPLKGTEEIVKFFNRRFIVRHLIVRAVINYYPLLKWTLFQTHILQQVSGLVICGS